MELTKEQQADIARMAREWAKENTTCSKTDEQDVAAAYIEGAEVAAGILEPELVRLRNELYDAKMQLKVSMDNTEMAIAYSKKLEAENELLRTDNQRLERWKNEALQVYSPVDDFVRENSEVFGVKIGESIQVKVLAILKIVKAKIENDRADD